MLQFPPLHRSLRRSAFSLVELLTVVALIAVLAAMVSAGFDTSSRRFQGGLAKVSDLFTLAHQHAVTLNTYTYVVFSEPDALTQTSYAAIVVSKDGADIAPFNSSGQLRQGVDFDAPGKIEIFENTEFPRVLPGGAVVSVPAAEDLRADEKTFVFEKMPGVEFSRFIKFTPRGEARVSPALAERVQLILQPRRGASSNDTDERRTSVVQVNGLTGKVNVYQP